MSFQQSVDLRDTAIIMPDDVAEEKAKALLALGAQIEKVRPASIVDKKQASVQFARSRSLNFTYLFIISLSYVCITVHI